ncbi:MAG: OB-fold domain-containing protein [Proteobacteria bacterium]|nr:OB-fold domain-containing protein [Pseudomonadota bacterium]
MGDEWRQEVKPIILEGGIHMPYSWTVGRVGSRFFIELRDKGHFLANRCTTCDHVWVPPRLRCPVCFKAIPDEDWLEVGPEGTLKHFTVVHYEQPAQPLAPPFAYGLITLDGADSDVAHLISDTDLDALKPGMRLKPVFQPDRRGNMLDIAYFTPTEG